MAALTGYRIIDLTCEDTPAVADAMLCEMGAEVIKVAAEEYVPVASKQAYRDMLNRGVKSVRLNIFTEEGAAVLKKLVASAQAVICNFTDEQLKPFGIDFEGLKTVNPSIVYVSTSSFGVIGETEDEPLIPYASSGLMYLSGKEGGEPIAIGYNAANHWSALITVFAICAGILHSIHQHEAAKMDIAERDGLFWLLEPGILDYTVFHKHHVRLGNHDTGVCPYGVFRAKDGHVALSITTNEKLWAKICEVIGKPEGVTDPHLCDTDHRLENLEETIAFIEEFTTQKGKRELQDLFQAAGISCGALLNSGEAMEEEQFAVREMVHTVDSGKYGKVKVIAQPMKFSDTPAEVVTAPVPTFGQDTDEVLASL